MRSELTPVQMAEHLVKWKELGEARETKTNYRSFEGRVNKGFASDTATSTDVETRTVQRAVSRAEGVTQEARDAIRGTQQLN